ncbi:MAG: DUF3168 domain-containing protein [Beijerinckiaceae bacterium]
MTSPIVALKEAIRIRLAADPAVLALIRAPKVHPEPPKHPTFPFLAFVTAEARENGTATDDGHVVDLTLGVFTRGTGSGEGAEIAEAARLSLAAAALAPPDHRVVNLIVRSVEPVAQRDGESWRTLVRIRATTEVI